MTRRPRKRLVPFLFVVVFAVLAVGSYLITTAIGGSHTATAQTGVVVTTSASSTTASPSTPASLAAPTALPVTSQQPSAILTPSSSPSQVMASGLAGDSDSFTMPDPIFGEVDNGATDQSFFGHTFPIPATWDGTMGDVGIRSFADMTTCNDVTADCPHIQIINLADPTQQAQYGADPVHAWLAQADCISGAKQPIQGPASATIDDQEASYYVQRCGQDMTAFNALAVWYFPGQHLMVTGQEGVNGSLDPGTIQAVLKRTTW